MIPRLFLALFLVLPAAVASQQDDALETEIRKIDAWASDPDSKGVAVAAMAEDLKVHRNHLVLLRKQTGESYGRIYVSSLRKAGLKTDAILARVRALNGEIQRRLEQAASEDGTGGSEGVRPLLLVNAGVDHNSAGTFYSLVPEIGIAGAHASVLVGIPYYRNTGTGFSEGGLGDVYATGAVYGGAAGFNLEGALTVGLPTGDAGQGLGAGRVTVDATATLARTFESVRPFVSAGVANSTFNFAYARPYIADGSAAHFSGGLEARAARRFTLGLGAFGVKPFGSQTVYSRIAAEQTGGATAPPSGGGQPGHMPGGAPGAGRGTPGTPRQPGRAPQHMPFLGATATVVPASELEDYGANAWASVTVARGVSLGFAVARSVPFRLTTAHVGVTFDLGRALRAH